MARRNNIAAQLYFLLLSAAYAPAWAADWYAGGSAGVSLYDMALSEIDDGSFTDSTGGASPSSENNAPPGFRLFAGFGVSEHLAVEAGYTSLGDAEVSAVSNSCCVWQAGKVTASVAYSGVEGAVLASSDVGGWALGGRLGLFAWDDSYEVRDSAGTYGDSETGVDLAVGIVASRGRLRLDLSHYALDRPVTSLMVGVVFRP